MFVCLVLLSCLLFYSCWQKALTVEAKERERETSKGQATACEHLWDYKRLSNLILLTDNVGYCVSANILNILFEHRSLNDARLIVCDDARVMRSLIFGRDISLNESKTYKMFTKELKQKENFIFFGRTCSKIIYLLRFFREFPSSLSWSSNHLEMISCLSFDQFHWVTRFKLQSFLKWTQKKFDFHFT